MVKGHHYNHHRQQEKNTDINKSNSMKLIDNLAYLAGILAIIFTFPQIIKIFSTHDATSISLWTWVAYTALSLVWIVYGFAHKAYPIAVTYIMWFIVDGLVVLGTLMYG